MKTKNWTFLVLAFFIASIGNATDFPKMNVIPVLDEKALVAFESNSAVALQLTISNEKEEIVYFKQSKKRQNNYSTILDFSEMGNGVYSVCLNYGNRSIRRDLYVSKDNIQVGPPLRCYEPYYRLEDESLHVSFLNTTRKNTFLIMFKDGEFVSRVKLGKDLAIQKRLNLSKLDKGEYNIVLSEGLTDHSFKIEI